MRKILNRGPGAFIAEVLQTALETVRAVGEQGSFNAVEIGCMYQTSEGQSTIQIAEMMNPHKSKRSGFISIEYDFEHIENARKIIERYDPTLLELIEFQHGPSFEVLPRMIGRLTPLNFAFIDAGAQPEICLKEFEIISTNLAEDGIIVMDDFQRIGPAPGYGSRRLFGKGTLILPLLVIQEYLRDRDKYLASYGLNSSEVPPQKETGLRGAENVKAMLATDILSLPEKLRFELVEEDGHILLVAARQHILTDFMTRLPGNINRVRSFLKRIQQAAKAIIRGSHRYT